MVYRNHTERYNMGLQKVYHFIQVLRQEKITDRTLQQYLYGALGEPLPIDVHRAMFIPTLENQADDEQQKKWLPLARNFKIFGAYAQTELGHGSNVQGIETTATYDKQTQEFVIHSPTLTSRKWWPGGLGKTGEFQVLDYQNQQFVLFPFIALSYAAFFAGKSMIKLHDSALDVITTGGSSFGLKLAELHAVSSGLKAWLAENVNNGIESCRRLCGGHGFSHSSNLAHIFNEAVGAVTYEGTFDVLVQQHARYLVKVLVSLPYKTEQNGPEGPTLTSFLARAKALADPSQRCSAVHGQDFLDLALLLAAFETRATRAILRLAAALQASNNDQNACMVLMTRASMAHSELILLQSFVQGLNVIPSGKNRDAVTTLCALFGLWLMTKNLGDFREDNYLSSRQADQAREQLLALLPIVRKNAVLLTDAWDFTDFEINSTIGRYDGDIYRAMVRRAEDEPLNKSQIPESYATYLKPLIQSSL
ncbi:hypothetical protein PINS_up000656 [Pythium insidiosum]|nr:hypothetical protein PINS_up000656 [Pythium insidiosum]